MVYHITIRFPLTVPYEKAPLYIFNYICKRLGCNKLQNNIYFVKRQNKWNQILDKAWEDCIRVSS